jgi:hypothetical protein
VIWRRFLQKLTPISDRLSRQDMDLTNATSLLIRFAPRAAKKKSKPAESATSH